MKTVNATATEARQHLNLYLNHVEFGATQVQIVRHNRVAAVMISHRDAERFRALEAAAVRPPVSEPIYNEKERSEIDQRIWDPAIRALMGLPPLSAEAIKAIRD